MGSNGSADDVSAAEAEQRATVIGEARWPMAVAVLAAMVLTLLVPETSRVGPRWLLPVIEGVLLVALVATDPGKIDRRSRELRALSIVLVSVLVVSSLWATGQLIDDLIHGGSAVNSAETLLRAGFIVWFSNNIAFGLLYWEIDGGGAAARAHRAPGAAGFGFPQQLSPGIGDPDWRPRFIDYLYVAFTNATAFSPTDAMPLVPWAKITMAIQAVVSLAILGLVIARAVNVFT